ncbi:MAG: hypothetical protein ACXVRH_00725 [Thermoleophilaceae bacterium]
MTAPEQFSSIDLIQLSDLAWTAVDPESVHEDEEALWAAALPESWPPPRSPEDLATVLADVVTTLSGTSNPARLKLVAAAMCFLADHPMPRALDEALLREALHEAFAADGVPTDVAAELSIRAARIDAHVKARAARHPAGHVRHHPSAEIEPEL